MRFHFGEISVHKAVARFRIPVGSLLRAAPGAFARQSGDCATQTGSCARESGDCRGQTGSFAQESDDVAAKTGSFERQCADFATQTGAVDLECARSMWKTVWIVRRTARLNAATARVFLVRASFGSQSKMACDPIGSAVARAGAYGDTHAALQPADGGGVRPVGASLRSLL